LFEILVSCLLAKQVNDLSTTMAKSSRTIIFLLSLTFAVIAGFNLSSLQVKHLLGTIASAVWGS